jgi:hypothetical protein
VKAFHSKMLMCDVLQERDAQLELKKRRLEQDKAVEEGWLQNDVAKMEEYDKRMQDRIEEMYKRKQDTAKVIKDQLHQSKMTYIKKLKDDILEGELIKRKAREDLEAARIAELQRRAKQARTREDLDSANQDLKAY